MTAAVCLVAFYQTSKKARPSQDIGTTFKLYATIQGLL